MLREMADSLVKRVLRDNKRLFALVYRFNCRPGLDIHPEHVAAVISPALLEKLRGSRRGEEKLSQWIAKEWKLDERGIWDFDDERQRVALLDYNTLWALAQHVGAAARRQQIAQVLDRNEQVKLKAALGGDLYQFALKRAPFLFKDLPETEAGAADADIPAQVATIGGAWLSACLADAPHELWRRLHLKLPKDDALDLRSSAPPEHRDTIWKNVKRILLTELKPHLAPCFN